MNTLNFASSTKLSALIAVLTIFLVALGCGGEKPSAAPTESEAQALVKSTLTDFTAGVDKGEFSTLRSNASNEFQSQFPEEKMQTTFKAFVDQKEVISPILKDAISKPVKFSTPPAVSEVNGHSILKTIGTIDSDPQPIKVDNEYVYQDSKWKLLKVSVSTE